MVTKQNLASHTGIKYCIDKKMFDNNLTYVKEV